MTDLGTVRDPLVARIAANIAWLRRARSWSQRDLAARAGVSLGTVGHIEAGRRGTSIQNLRRIAVGLGVGPALLLADLTTRCPHCDGCPPEGFVCTRCAATSYLEETPSCR